MESINTHKVNQRNYPGKLFHPSNSLLCEPCGYCGFWNSSYITSFTTGFLPTWSILLKQPKNASERFKQSERGISQ
jgi:hypothetical protein